MSSRLIVTGSATGLAAVVLGLTMLAGEKPRRAESQAPIVPIEPGRDPELPSGGLLRIGGGYEISRRTTSGNVLELKADSYEPLPDGAADVERLRTRIYTAESRTIEIRADNARVYAPDNRPRHGTLHGNVQVRYFTSTREEDLEQDSPHEKVRCFLDEARFEKEMGQIDSDSPVHLSTPRAEVRGQGIYITHSEMDNQIKKLVGFRNGTMRLLSGAAIGGDGAAPAADERDQEGPDTAASTTTPQEADTVPPAPKPTEQAQETTPTPAIYKATFHEDVLIQSSLAQVHAEELQLIFDLGGDAGRDQLFDQLSAALKKTVPNVLMLSPVAGSNTRFARGGSSRHDDFPHPATRVPHPVSRVPHPISTFVGIRSHAPSLPVFAALFGTVPGGANVAAWPSLTPHGPDDTIIKWRGQLTVVPVDPDSAEAAELDGPQDVVLTLVGEPVRIIADGDELIVRAATVGYQTGSGRVRLSAFGQTPLIVSRSMGAVIEAPKLVIDQARAEGVISGPGTVRAHDEGRFAAVVGPDGRPKRLPPGTQIQWSEALDLRFHRRAESSASERGDLRIAALRDAVFRGEVKLRHPSLSLDADSLTIDLSEPEDGRQTINDILAAGHVVVETLAQSDEPAMKVRCDWLTLHLDRLPDDSMQPTRFEARGGDQEPLIAWYGAMKLSAGKMNVALHRAPDDEAPGRARRAKAAQQQGAPPAVSDARLDQIATSLETGDEPELEPVPGFMPPTGPVVRKRDALDDQFNVAPRLFVAEQDVRIEVQDEDALIEADRVVADVPAGRLELYGTASRLARIERPDGVLRGQYVVLTKDSETARVIGPGRAMYFQQPRPVLAAAKNSRNDQPPPATLDVSWRDSMQFDNIAGLAQFVGGVDVRSTLENDTFNLTTQDLRIVFMDVPAPEGSARRRPLSRAPAAGNAPLGKFTDARRAVKSLEARGDMVFLAETWVDQPGGELATSVQLMGPNLHFLELTEQVKVNGPGSMVLLDRRSPTDRPRGGQDGSPSMVSFAGRGNTLFEWSGDLTLDANKNDMLIRDEVKMTHMSQDTDEVLIMNCRRFLADLEATGGLKVWLGQNMPKPAVEKIRADGDVRLLKGETRIATDHLLYTGANELVRLDADDGWSTQISTENTLSMSGRAILWYLKTGRFEVMDLGPVRLGR